MKQKSNWMNLVCVLGGVFFVALAETAEVKEKVTVETGNTVADFLSRGSMAEEQGRSATAVEYYRAAVDEFDRQRPMMAEALFRLATSYLKIGASESASVVFGRIQREFADQTDVVQRVPEILGLGKAVNDNLVADPNSAVGQKGGQALYDLLDARPDVLNVDPIMEEMRLMVESAKREMELALKQKDAAAESLERAKLRAEIAGSSTPLSLPSSVDPGIEYEELKGQWQLYYLDNSKSKDREVGLKESERHIVNWIEGIFLPQLNANQKAAAIEYRKWVERYEVAALEYRAQIDEAQKRAQAIDDKNRVEEKKGREKARVSVLGQVKNPGFYELPKDFEVSLMQVVALAGGYLPNARKIIVYRNGEKNSISLSEEKMQTEANQFYIRHGDIVDVEPRFF